ncbi:MAG: cob(I)alamin adenosyltransferase [Myxococcota bacterium]|jgi:cob(I)alamin adenosyltransferase
MRITRVYTRTGDTGTTRLVGGQKVNKDDVRIEAYGTVDELNAVLGLARTFNASSRADGWDRIDAVLGRVQNDLFNVGTDLATPAPARWEGMYRVGESDVAMLEGDIDAFNGELPPLEEFILPGGGPVGAFLHQGRTVCRRAERCVVVLMHHDEDVGSGSMKYLNRLSDLLFVLARWAARAHGEAEFQWVKPALRSE